MEKKFDLLDWLVVIAIVALMILGGYIVGRDTATSQSAQAAVVDADVGATTDSSNLDTTTSNDGSASVDNGSTTIDGSTSFNASGACELDKVGTWSEGNGPFRIEVGGHMVQHFDFYPAPGVPAISYIVPPIADPEGVPSIAHGYGSMWEGPSCDYVADATHYARARLDSGHSGLVVVWGTWEVLANVNNYDDVAGLLGIHRAAMS